MVIGSRGISALFRAAKPVFQQKGIQKACESRHAVKQVTSEVQNLKISHGGFSSHRSLHTLSGRICSGNSSILQNAILPTVTISARSIIKVSMRSGKRKGCKSVPARFYRLGWGAWIRTIAGRHKKLWKKNPKKRRRYALHVFCNGRQSRKLDQMVSKYYRQRRYYIDDLYAPYQERQNFEFTRSRPEGENNGNFWLNRALTQLNK